MIAIVILGILVVILLIGVYTQYVKAGQIKNELKTRNKEYNGGSGLCPKMKIPKIGRCV